MNLYKRYLSVALLAALLLPVACKSISRFSQGRVIDEEGRPLTGVRVKEMHGMPSATTDRNGYFRLDKAPDRIDDLVFEKEGYRNDTIPSVFTHSGESIDYNFQGKDTTVVILRKSIAP
ncbi:carboxypeptidase-like regulatory domain-containing protein [Taibaiella koreensis]|uniref:carboxypeptidase-like regulatory domain-containing protein n=1 Tax=Taibaiella koreensis TaxID=1268548 RepID=UPI0013C2F4B7|nr:carboxypeptidase-like regulatory domain-containing protein [Taibaiella koreensis]